MLRSTFSNDTSNAGTKLNLKKKGRFRKLVNILVVPKTYFSYENKTHEKRKYPENSNLFVSSDYFCIPNHFLQFIFENAKNDNFIYPMQLHAASSL